jgi:hypothetical protein
MAVQLRGQLGSGLGLPQLLPATLMFDHPTIAALAQVLAGYLDRATRDGSVPPDVVVAAAAAATVPAAAAAPVAVPAAPPEPASQAAAARGAATASPLDILEADDVAALSDAQIEALVLARLQETMT